MELSLRHEVALDGLDTPLLVAPVFSGDKAEIAQGAAALVPATAAADARGTSGAEVMSYSTAGGPTRVALVGAGKSRAEMGLEDVRRFAGRAVRLAERQRITSLTLLLPELDLDVAEAHQAVAEGLCLAGWNFRELKTGVGEDESPSAVTAAVVIGFGDAAAAQAGFDVGRILATAENKARDFQMRPGNIATPTHLAEQAEQIASETGMSVDILGPDRLKAERMNAILTVSAGSNEEPRLIVLKHDGGKAGDKPLVLVGKGLTFDAGGISIKPAAGMEDMKFDMSGGAAVLAAMWAVATLGIKRNVVGVVPSSENLLGGSAVKPGDIITTRAGITVEVINTDAEGRLILCDALDYATEMEPEAMVDCATLTGAVVIGLGHNAIGVMGTDQSVVDEVLAAGELSGERGWQLPLWPEYRTQLESPAADLKNVGGRPAGSITAATFLREFVKDVPWAHLDIAGTAYGTGGKIPYRRAGGYGVPTRMLVEWVRGRAT